MPCLEAMQSCSMMPDALSFDDLASACEQSQQLELPCRPLRQCSSTAYEAMAIARVEGVQLAHALLLCEAMQQHCRLTDAFLAFLSACMGWAVVGIGPCWCSSSAPLIGGCWVELGRANGGPLRCAVLRYCPGVLFGAASCGQLLTGLGRG